MPSLGQKLKELREQQGKTQQDIANLLCLNRVTYTQYENNKRVPSIDTLKKLSEIYMISLDQLTNNVSYREDLPKYYFSKKLLDDALKTEEGKEHLYKLIEDHAINPKTQNNKIPIFNTIKNSSKGLILENPEGYILASKETDDNYFAWKCKDDSMKDLGIYIGDIAIIRLQKQVESGELAVVIIENDESTLKRVRKFNNGIILESANPAYPPQIFTGNTIKLLNIVGKVIEVRKFF